MNLSLIQLSIERLLNRVENLESENEQLKERIEQIETQGSELDQETEPNQDQEDVLIDTKEVLNILGISYNTLRAIVRKGLLNPIKINQRRVRYSKKALFEYIKSRSVKPTE